MTNIVIILHDIRSTHNVGSILRTADGFGISKVYITGYTPYPITKDDARLPHIANKLQASITKTSLGAENTVSWQGGQDLGRVIVDLKSSGYTIYALEQAKNAINLSDLKPEDKVAFIVGTETTGLDKTTLKQVDKIVEIPMLGSKESFNVAVAAAICMYHLRFSGQINIS